MTTKLENKKTVTCPNCKDKVILDRVGNYKERYVQCTTCSDIFLNPYYAGGNENEETNYVG